MKGGEDVLVWLQIFRCQNPGCRPCLVFIIQHCIIHHISRLRNLAVKGSESFVLKIFYGSVSRTKKIFAHPIGKDAVYLLGHIPVEASEAGFHMSDGNMKL